MDATFVLRKLNGSREAMAKLLGVATITTYRWKDRLPEKHVRYLRALKPEWFRELAQRREPRGF